MFMTVCSTKAHNTGFFVFFCLIFKENHTACTVQYDSGSGEYDQSMLHTHVKIFLYS